MKATNLFLTLALTLVSVGIQAQNVELDIERSVKVEFNSEKGYSYNVYGTSDPAKKTGWKLLGGEDGTGENIVFFYRTESDQKIFFRVESEPSEPGEEPKPQEPVQSVIPITGLPPAESSGTYNLAQAIGENEIGGVYRIGVSSGTDGVVIVLPHPGLNEYRQKQIKLSIYRGGTGLGSGKVSLKVRTPGGDAYEARKLVDNSSKQLTDEVVILPATALESGRKVIVDLFNDTANTDGAAGGQWVVSTSTQGSAGPVGPRGQRGSIEYEWDGTSLRFKNSNDSWSDWVDLRGAQGQRGQSGKNLEFEWSGSRLRTRAEGGAWSEWTNLQGTTEVVSSQPALGIELPRPKSKKYENIFDVEHIVTGLYDGYTIKDSNLIATFINSTFENSIISGSTLSETYYDFDVSDFIRNRSGTFLQHNLIFNNSTILNSDIVASKVTNSTVTNSTVTGIYNSFSLAGSKLINSNINLRGLIVDLNNSTIEQTEFFCVEDGGYVPGGYQWNKNITQLILELHKIQNYSNSEKTLNAEELNGQEELGWGLGSVLIKGADLSGANIIDPKGLFIYENTTINSKTVMDETAQLRWEIYNKENQTFLNKTIIGNLYNLETKNINFIDCVFTGTGKDWDLENVMIIDCDIHQGDYFIPAVELKYGSLKNCDFSGSTVRINDCTVSELISINSILDLGGDGSYESNNRFYNCDFSGSKINLFGFFYENLSPNDFENVCFLGSNFDAEWTITNHSPDRSREASWGEREFKYVSYYRGLPNNKIVPSFSSSSNFKNIITPKAEIHNPILSKYAAPTSLNKRKVQSKVRYATGVYDENSVSVISFVKNNSYKMVSSDNSEAHGVYKYTPNGSTAYLEFFETEPDAGNYDKYAIIFTKSDGGLFGGKGTDIEDGLVSGTFEFVD